jgi:GGDEF domain-containing protein
VRADSVIGQVLGGASVVGALVAVVADTTAGAVVAGACGAVAGALLVATDRRAAATSRRLAAAEADAEAGRAELERTESRVRTLEDELDRPERVQGTDELLTDPETGMPGRAYFAVNLDARLETARRNLRPVSIVLVEVGEPSGLPAPTPFVGDALRATLRAADTVCRLDGYARFGVILEDTSEQGAVQMVERFRRTLLSHARMPHILSAGIASYPAHGLDTEELRLRAVAALDAAKEWREDRIEVAPAEA